LADVMNAIVRYSPTVQDVSVTDAQGLTLVSTDPDALNEPVPRRMSLQSVRQGSIAHQTKVVFGQPRVLDIQQSLDRNGAPFLIVHVGVRSTFLRASYEPWLKAALVFALLAAFAAMIAAALLANVALQPLEVISRKLESLTINDRDASPQLPEKSGATDEVGRVTKTIDRLGQQIRTAEEGYTALQANLAQMLDTLRDGVLLFTADHRAVMVSDAVAYFLSKPESELVGKQLAEIFEPE